MASTCKVHVINVAGKEVFEDEANSNALVEFTSTACTGTPEAPTATAGNLCIYIASLTNASALVSDTQIRKAGASTEETGASTIGAVFAPLATGTTAEGWGSWAVTAP